MNPLYPDVARRAGHRCEYCRAPEVVFNFLFEVEHILPTSMHGSDDLSNLALACHSCNLHKSDHTTGIDEVTQTVVPVFNPRQDRWDQHFQFDTEAGEIRGITPIGRATVGRLDMNSPAQIGGRALWARFRLYP
jgi:hypothetical protein